MAIHPVYGFSETNGLDTQDDREAHRERLARMEPDSVDWTEPGLKITRLRLLSDIGFPVWDVSYCHGELPPHPGSPPGTPNRVVKVDLPFSQLPKRGYLRAIVKYAKKDGVYAHGIGILANVSTLV